MTKILEYKIPISKIYKNNKQNRKIRYEHMIKKFDKIINDYTDPKLRKKYIDEAIRIFDRDIEELDEKLYNDLNDLFKN